MAVKTTSGRSKGRVPGVALPRTKTVEDYARAFEQTMDKELPVSLGFSARLNMLWDLAGAAPPRPRDASSVCWELIATGASQMCANGCKKMCCHRVSTCTTW